MASGRLGQGRDDLPSPRNTQLSDILERDRALSQPRRFAPLRRDSQGTYQHRGVRAAESSVDSRSTATTIGGMEQEDFFEQMREAENENSDAESEEEVQQPAVRKTLQ